MKGRREKNRLWPSIKEGKKRERKNTSYCQQKNRSWSRNIQDTHLTSLNSHVSPTQARREGKGKAGAPPHPHTPTPSYPPHLTIAPPRTHARAPKSKSPTLSKLVYNSEETEPVDLWNENARLEVGGRGKGDEGGGHQQGEKNAKHHKSLSLCFPSPATASSPLASVLGPGTILPRALSNNQCVGHDLWFLISSYIKEQYITPASGNPSRARRKSLLLKARKRGQFAG